MPIKNYTTKIDAFTSLGEIQGALARNGAGKIMVEYGDTGLPESICFVISVPNFDRPQGFKLTARVEGVERVFTKQKVRADREQAERTAWRNIRDWVMAQMAMLESEQATLDELFLPVLLGNGGQTLFEAYREGQLLLPEA